MEDFIPITSLFMNHEKTIINFTVHEKVLAKNNAKYTVYIITDDNKKYYYEEYNIEDKNEYDTIEIDPNTKSITLLTKDAS